MTPERFAVVERVFQAALDVPPDHRAVYLDEACGGDAALRREVESLLAAALGGDGPLDTPPIHAAGPRRLEPGQRLGVYEITGELGAGGMGIVYRARDTRLGRAVAIKVLGDGVAFDPSARERFTREARIVASLTHPHICPVYDIGCEAPSGRGPGGDDRRGEPVDFIVMEWVEGETLAARLRKGPLRPEQALDIAAQIADALASAHGRGVVHRDVKPANVMLTKAGVKLLDFGLARNVERGEGLLASQADPATRARSITAPGVIVGTVRYMAPEQVEGKAADARTDLWALGAVIYEMVAGKAAFDGESAAALMAAILERDPAPLASVHPLTPPSLDRLVTRCLAKDPDHRWRDAGDLAQALRWVAADVSTGRADATRPSRPSRSRVLPWAVGGALLGLLGGTLLPGLIRPGTSPPRTSTIEFSVQAPEGAGFYSWHRPAVSPDGERIVFGGTTPDGRSVLWVRRLDSTATPRLIPDEVRLDYLIDSSVVGASVFWKPDSRQVAFISAGFLMKTDLSSGAPQKLCDEPATSSGAWSRDGLIVFSTPKGPLYRVSEQGGVATLATSLDATRLETSHAFPSFLPDGKRFLYLARSATPANTGVFVGALDGSPPTQVLAGESFAMYAPPGYLVYLRGSALVAQPFDVGQLRVAGEPLPVAEQVGSLIRSTVPIQSPLASVSDNGVLCYLSEPPVSTQLEWFDRTGARLGPLSDAGDYTNPALSPDGRQLAIGRRDPQTGTRDIWVIDVARGTRSRLTFDPADDFNPQWSPDGSDVAFSSNRRGHRDLFRRPASGTGADELLWESAEDKSLQDWAANGMISANLESRPSPEIWGFRSPATLGQDDAAPRLLLAVPSGCDQTRTSPDGRWVAYRSAQSGRMEVYVQSLSASNGRRQQVSTDGGLEPQWRGDGRELFYLEGASLMAVAVNPGPSAVEIGTPTKLFVAPLEPEQRRNRYVVTKDGKRFLIVTPLSPMPRTLKVVVNWTSRLGALGER